MPIIFNSKLSSTVANATFLDKTVDDTTIGILDLNETTSGNSGDQVTNTQRQININKKVIFGESTKSNGDTITLDALSRNQEVRVIGNAASIVMNVLPFSGVQVVLDGTEIMIVGHSDTDTVSFSLNDVDYGLYINGTATLKRGYILNLIYNDELKRYFEVSRNF